MNRKTNLSDYRVQNAYLVHDVMAAHIVGGAAFMALVVFGA